MHRRRCRCFPYRRPPNRRPVDIRTTRSRNSGGRIGAPNFRRVMKRKATPRARCVRGFFSRSVWIRGRVDPWPGWIRGPCGSAVRVDPRSVWIRGRVDPWPGWIRGRVDPWPGWIRGPCGSVVRVDPWPGGNRALFAWSVGLADFRPRDEKCRFPAGATKNQFPPRDYGLCIPAPAALFWTKNPAALF